MKAVRAVRNEIKVPLSVFPTASLSIAELFSGPYLLNVPIFQRPYSWGREEAEHLLDDLIEAGSIGVDRGNVHDYFLGAILLMDTPGNATVKLSARMSPREFDVIDGQQRIVTLMTMLAVLRDLEEERRKPIGKRVKRMLVAQRGGRFFGKERLRLHLAGRERVTFEEGIVKVGNTIQPAEADSAGPSEMTLLEVRDRYRTLLSELSGAARKSLADFIADHCHVAVIVGNDIDRAHQMFVVLNERGKRLQRNDIIKSDILSRMPGSETAWAAKNWDEISAELGDGFEPFFGHLRTIFGYARLQIVSGVRTLIDNTGGAETFFKDIFIPYARAYILIRKSGAGELPAEMQRILKYLNRLPDADWAPAAILALKDWQGEPERAEFLLREIERFAMLLRLLCAGSGKRVRRFAELIKTLRSSDPISVAHPVLQITRDETRSIAFHLRDLHKRNPKVCRLLLMRLSDELGDVPSTADPDLYTIEHVLPQRPSATSVWRQAIPSGEERAELIESLGNLVLITQQDNDRARNASWDEKREIYARSSDRAPLLAITRDVLGESEWRRAEIERRECRLTGLIENLWRIDIQSQRPASRVAATVEAQKSVPVI